jgi:fermentation-respiration switch protein FrsA (DUF1100 family)
MIIELAAASVLLAPIDTVREREVTIPGPVQLEGTLTLPAGDGPFPGLVIVHGSGAGDRDGSLGPNKPYRDLAQGLAQRGVAVLRYEKRSRAQPMWFLNRGFTVRDEVIEDAVAALALLREQSEVDASRTFLAGHSLGGILAPRIAAADGKLAGFVMLAGAWVTPLPQLMLKQLDYIASVSSPADSARVMSQRSAIGAMVDRLEKLTPADSAETTLLMGAPAAYWLDLRSYNPVAALLDRSEPVLMIQGGRDYQVTPAMLDEFLDRLGKRENTTVRRYSSLNHLLIAGEGVPRPAEYATAGRVSDEVIVDVANWVLQADPRR